MRLFNRKTDENIKGKLLRRLRKVDDVDLIRWLDTINTGVGKNISEIRKSLPRNPEQALVYLQDTRSGAVSLLAALQVLEERISE